MQSTTTTLHALCACEITYHLRKDSGTGLVKVDQVELVHTLNETKAQLLKQSLWNGVYEERSFLDDAAGCWICKTPRSEILIAFRGTAPFVLDLSTTQRISRSFEALKDGLRNTFINFEEGQYIDDNYGKGSQVHQGFHQEVENMWGFVLSTIQELDPDGKLPITITGHSQGGGIAFLVALRLCVGAKKSAFLYRQEIGKRIQQVITFGAPQAGSAGFAKNYEQCHSWGIGTELVAIMLDKITYRYEHAGDCIPFLPNKATDLLGLVKHKYSFLPVSFFFLETMVANMKSQLEQYVSVGQLRYITYSDQKINPDQVYELRLADLYLAWAVKGKYGDIFSIHFLFKDDGYMKMYWDPPKEENS